MTLEEMFAQFRADVDDEQAQAYLFNDVELFRWVNEAMTEATIRSKLIFDNTTAAICDIAVTPGTSTYALDVAVHDIEAAFLYQNSAIVWKLTLIDRLELDRIEPNWREATGAPTHVIRDDTSIQLTPAPEASYTVKLEVYRAPLDPMDSTDQEPGIGAHHHRYLVEWMKYRAYSKPDVETKDDTKAATALAEFTTYFGPRPDADQRRRQQANKPHFNKASW